MTIKPSWRASLPGLALAFLLTLVLSAFLRWNASTVDHGARIEAMPVTVTRFREQDYYQGTRRFFGLIEAGKRAELGFETSGELASVSVREGHRVSRGQLLARLDDRRLEAQRKAAQAEIAMLDAELELAELKARRQRELQASGAVSKEAYDETRLRAKALGAQREGVAARLQQLDIELEKLQLKAPYDGVVAEHYRDQGAIVAAGTPILRLIQHGVREAHVGVAPKLARELVIAQPYQLTWRDQVIMATLRAVRPDVDPATRSATAVFELPADLPALDGEAVSLSLEKRVEERGGWLPLSALLEGQRGVWNVLGVEERDGRDITVREVVEVLDIRARQAYVRGTLLDGQRVVADGIHRIAPGSSVTPLQGGN